MNLTLHPGRLRAGVWEAVLSGDAEPAVEALHQGCILPGPSLSAIAGRPGEWMLRLAVPSDRLDHGVQTFLLRAKADGQTLGHFTIVSGVPLEADLRAEIDLLRAELDLLKRAFRRHVRDGATETP
jgi:hypothetical protein